MLHCTIPFVATMFMPPDAELWCARAEGATYSDAANVPVSIANPDGSPPEGCVCIPLASAVHDWIEDHSTGGRVIVEQSVLQLELGAANPLAELLLETRDIIYDAAVRECIDLVPAIATSHTCSDPSRFDMIPATPSLEPREIYRGDGCLAGPSTREQRVSGRSRMADAHMHARRGVVAPADVSEQHRVSCAQGQSTSVGVRCTQAPVAPTRSRPPRRAAWPRLAEIPRPAVQRCAVVVDDPLRPAPRFPPPILGACRGRMPRGGRREPWTTQRPPIASPTRFASAIIRPIRGA
jgi:hypothetical protein